MDRRIEKQVGRILEVFMHIAFTMNATKLIRWWGERERRGKKARRSGPVREHAFGGPDSSRNPAGSNGPL